MKILETLTSIYVESDELQTTIDFYEQLFNEPCHFRFQYPEYYLKLAAVGSVLIISGKKQHRKPFELTKMTCHVDDLKKFRQLLISNGVEILEEPKRVPTGTNMLVRHPDGLVAEYVEHSRIMETNRD